MVNIVPTNNEFHEKHSFWQYHDSFHIRTQFKVQHSLRPMRQSETKWETTPLNAELFTGEMRCRVHRQNVIKSNGIQFGEKTKWKMRRGQDGKNGRRYHFRTTKIGIFDAVFTK